MICQRLKTRNIPLPSCFAVPKHIRLNYTYWLILKTPNKQEIKQIAFNHSSDIDFQDVMNLCKKCTAKHIRFLVIDTTLASYNSLCFRENSLERIQKLIMTTDDKTESKKLQHDIKSEAAKVLALSAGIIDKY